MAKKKRLGLIIGLSVGAFVLVITAVVVLVAIFFNKLWTYEEASYNVFGKTDTVYYTEDKSIAVYNIEGNDTLIATRETDGVTSTYLARISGRYLYFSEYEYNGTRYYTKTVSTFHGLDGKQFDKYGKIIYKTNADSTVEFVSCAVADWQGTIPNVVTYIEENQAQAKVRYDLETSVFATENTVYYTADKSIVIYNVGSNEPLVATQTKDGVTKQYLVKKDRTTVTLYEYTYSYYERVADGHYTQNSVLTLSSVDLDKLQNESKVVYRSYQDYEKDLYRTEEITTEFISCAVADWEGEIPNAHTLEEIQKLYAYAHPTKVEHIVRGHGTPLTVIVWFFVHVVPVMLGVGVITTGIVLIIVFTKKKKRTARQQQQQDNEKKE